MNGSYYDEGLEAGQRRLIASMLEVRFNSLSKDTRSKLAAWPADKLEELGKALVKAKSLRELGLES